MTAYDARARSQAARMLAPVSRGGKGQTVTITDSTAPTFDPATDTATGGGGASQTCSGVEEFYSSRSIDGTLIKVGDVKFLLSPFNSAGLPITAPVADRHVLKKADGLPWAIKNVDVLAPAGTPVMYTLQLRAGG